MSTVPAFCPRCGEATGSGPFHQCRSGHQRSLPPDPITPGVSGRTCWRSECRNGCYYPDVCTEKRDAIDVGIPASEDPNDLSINEWQMLDSALGDVDPATHDAVMSTARQIRVNARTECLCDKVTHMGLTHDCDDPECHVAGFVRTLTLHMPAELAPAYRGAALLRLAADALEAQPPKLRAQYVAALRLYADEPWRLTGATP